MKKILLGFIVMLISTISFSQKIHFNCTDSTQSSYGLEDVRKITFEGDVMNLHLFDGSLYVWNVSTIGNYEYEETPLNTQELLKLYSELSFPCFVKPNNGGSSIGTHKVYDKEALEIALKDAFKHDKEVIVEEFIKGIEFSVGIIKTSEEDLVLPLTEIIVETDFFDYKQKYSDNGATEITPADIENDKALECQKIVKKVFKILRLKKVARIDFILQDDNFYLIEVNTIPGMSPKSILPQQAKPEGMSFSDLISKLGIL